MTEQPGPGAGQQQQEQQAPPPAPPPAAQPPAAPVQQEGIRDRDPAFVWVLSIFTFGIYHWIWYYQFCKELGEWSRGRIDTDPVTSTLAITLGSIVIVPPIVSYFGSADRMRQAQEMAGVEPRMSGWGMFFRNFLFGYGYYWCQQQLNELAERRPA